jgi:uncharacterized protein YjlB
LLSSFLEESKGIAGVKSIPGLFWTMNRADRENHFRNIVEKPEITAHVLSDDGIIPNNVRLPLLIYTAALRLPAEDADSLLQDLFASNRWTGSWVNGIYSYHHYHSTAHEVLGIIAGSAKVRLGGERGITQTVRSGDVLVIPAGVAHKNLGSSSDFSVVGAYPAGQKWDICYGEAKERPKAEQNILSVAMPHCDPVYGESGPLFEYWIR